MSSFTPKILGFLCNWCAYAGADLAGVSRFQYPSNIRVIRVMCSGRVDPTYIFDAFQNKIDGVMVLGCHPGDCHYQTGNYEAENKMMMTKKVLEVVGIEPQRLYLDWVSAAEGKRFSEVITQFTTDLQKLGPLARDKDCATKAVLGEHIVENTTIRWLVGKERELIERGNVYKEKLNKTQLDDLLDKNILEQYRKLQIGALIEKKPLSVEAISTQLSLKKEQIFHFLSDMEEQGKVTLYDFKDNKPRYQKVAVEGASE